jgi:hypothetical protein
MPVCAWNASNCCYDIEMTRRYARLTDKSREEEYFRAMEIIEQGGINGAY